MLLVAFPAHNWLLKGNEWEKKLYHDFLRVVLCWVCFCFFWISLSLLPALFKAYHIPFSSVLKDPGSLIPNYSFFQVRKLEADILPLQESNAELSEKSGMLQAEKKLLEEDVKRWKARTQVGNASLKTRCSGGGQGGENKLSTLGEGKRVLKARSFITKNVSYIAKSGQNQGNVFA